jgi:formylglycine-generating enzyme
MRKAKLLSLLILLAACTTKVPELVGDNCSEDGDSPTPVVRVSSILPPKEKKPCPDDMIYIQRPDHSFCIDQFEFPNKVGENPISGISAYEAEDLCSSVGKRICTYDEWYVACVGKSKQLFSYGQHHISVCNDHKSGYIQPDWSRMTAPGWEIYVKTLYKADTIGSNPWCQSDEGVHDMLGNIREWTKAANSQYGYIIPASYWYGDMANDLSCRYKITNHAPTFASYEFGVRACKDIDR